MIDNYPFKPGDWIHPLTAAQHAVLEHMTASKAKALARWQAKCQPASDYVTIYVDVAQGSGDAALSLLRKAARKLPSRFVSHCSTAISRATPLPVTSTSMHPKRSTRATVPIPQSQVSSSATRQHSALRILPAK